VLLLSQSLVVPPSPPAKKKKTNARQDQAEHPITVPSGNGRVENQRVTRCRCKRQHIREHAQVRLFMTHYSVVTPRKRAYQAFLKTDTARPRCSESSSDLLPPSPPAEKAAAVAALTWRAERPPGVSRAAHLSAGRKNPLPRARRARQIRRISGFGVASREGHRKLRSDPGDPPQR
jgi:hypothetical protein